MRAAQQLGQGAECAFCLAHEPLITIPWQVFKFAHVCGEYWSTGVAATTGATQVLNFLTYSSYQVGSLLLLEV